MPQPERLSGQDAVFPPDELPPKSQDPQENRLPAVPRLPPGLPLMFSARDLTLHAAPAPELRLVTPPAETPPRKKETPAGAMLRGIKDLQQLQKQTIAVLESVKGALDDIQQVLRSPEATRGMEKQHNAAMLLAKGFAREAIDQAQGAVSLLPANPEAHLLLSLSLASDQQFDGSLAAARKGLALFDRRAHPLAIEAGLLHALAALGCAPEAVERWAGIIDGLPLPVLFENLARIAAGFPTDADVEIEGIAPDCENLLDDLICRRLARHDQNPENQGGVRRRPRLGMIELRPDEIPAATLFRALDAAHDHDLCNTHRAILGQIARRLQLVRPGPQAGAGSDDAGGGAGAGGGELSHAGGGGVVRFINECVIPLGNRGLDKSAAALGRAAVKRLLAFHADAMTLHRAMLRLEMAAAHSAAGELATLLQHWRRAGKQRRRRRVLLWSATALVACGLIAFIEALQRLGALSGRIQAAPLSSHPGVFWGPGLMALGVIACFLQLFQKRMRLQLPHGRGPLSAAEISFLNQGEVKQTLLAARAGR